MHAYSTGGWGELFLAGAGASAALAGRVVITQVAVLPLLAGGVSLLLRAGGGLYWLVPGVVLCLVVAVLDAWVLLIEILR
jgi:hypothetical protein